MTLRLRIGTRGSPLALAQTNLLVAQLQALAPDLQPEVVVIRTQGDADQQSTLAAFAGQGVFVSEIERALVQHDIDIAVHSYKDMPSRQPDGLTITAFPARGDPRDVLVSRNGQRLADLPAGARVGTGSPRRRALLAGARPDLVIAPVRGNVDSRLRFVAEGRFDAVVLAAAGLARLQRESAISEYLDPSRFVPAVGQGILAIETRADDADVVPLVARLDHEATRACATAERAVAVAIDAGCQAPFGAHAAVAAERLTIDAFLEHDGQVLRLHDDGTVSEAAFIGAGLGHALLAQRRPVTLP